MEEQRIVEGVEYRELYDLLLKELETYKEVENFLTTSYKGKPIKSISPFTEEVDNKYTSIPRHLSFKLDSGVEIVALSNENRIEVIGKKYKIINIFYKNYERVIYKNIIYKLKYKKLYYELTEEESRDLEKRCDKIVKDSIERDIENQKNLIKKALQK